MPLRELEKICDEIFERWDKDQRSGKLLTALAGRLPGYRADVDRVRAALTAEWHPISTAPRDGTDIVLCSWVLHDTPGGPFSEMVVASWDVEECGGDGGWILGDSERPLETEPIGWRPLPTAPDRPTHMTTLSTPLREEG